MAIVFTDFPNQYHINHYHYGSSNLGELFKVCLSTYTNRQPYYPNFSNVLSFPGSVLNQSSYLDFLDFYDCYLDVYDCYIDLDDCYIDFNNDQFWSYYGFWVGQVHQ